MMLENIKTWLKNLKAPGRATLAVSFVTIVVLLLLGSVYASQLLQQDQIAGDDFSVGGRLSNSYAQPTARITCAGHGSNVYIACSGKMSVWVDTCTCDAKRNCKTSGRPALAQSVEYASGICAHIPIPSNCVNNSDLCLDRRSGGPGLYCTNRNYIHVRDGDRSVRLCTTPSQPGHFCRCVYNGPSTSSSASNSQPSGGNNGGNNGGSSTPNVCSGGNPTSRWCYNKSVGSPGTDTQNRNVGCTCRLSNQDKSVPNACGCY